MSAVLARAAISLNEYFSVTQIDAAIVGFMGAMLWWWLPSKRPQPPAPGKPERLERMADRIDAFVAGLLLAVLVNVRLQLTPYAQTFDVSSAPLIHSYRISMPLTAVVLYLGWLHVLVPLYRSVRYGSRPAASAERAAKPDATNGDGAVRVAKVAAAAGDAATVGAAPVKGGAGGVRSLAFDAMDRVVQLWNLFLSAGSFVMLVGLIDGLIGYGNQTNWSLFELLADTKRLRWSGPAFFILYLFQMSKFIELFDTVLLVARARPVVFLHWYHHASVLAYCWVSVSVTYAPGWWFGTVNCAVHTIMYWYYFRSGCGIKLAYDKFITTIQIVQMAVGIALTLGWLYLHLTYPSVAGGLLDPSYSTLMVLSSSGMYASYLFLFAAFYINRYWKKSSAAGKSSKANGSATGAAVTVKAPKAVAAGGDE